MGHFVVKSKTNLDSLNIGDIINESDFASLTPEGNFVQLEYIDKSDFTRGNLEVKPGIFTIIKDMSGYHLEPTNFTKDVIMEAFINTKQITDKADMFFENAPVYKEFGFDIAKRGILLYGPPGTGKSTSLAAIANKYTATNDTIVVVWNTDKYEAHEIKDFIKTFDYNKHGVKRLILIAEDIGGVEIDQVRMRSDSSLLALLDNQEKTFTTTTLIIATTNYPEVFMGNLTNRPNRFDDKIEVGFPTAEARQSLLKFFDKKNMITEEASELIASKKCEKFSPAHIREIIVRAAIHRKTLVEVINEMLTEINHYEKAFQKTRSTGLFND